MLEKLNGEEIKYVSEPLSPNPDIEYKIEHKEVTKLSSPIFLGPRYRVTHIVNNIEAAIWIIFASTWLDIDFLSEDIAGYYVD